MSSEWLLSPLNACHCLQLLQQDPKKRLDSLEALKQESIMADVDWESVEAVNVQPSFVPPVSFIPDSLSRGLLYSTCMTITINKLTKKANNRLRKITCKWSEINKNKKFSSFIFFTFKMKLIFMKEFDWQLVTSTSQPMKWLHVDW